MGKGTIASGGTDGLYQVTLDYGQAARDARLAKINSDLAALVSKIAAAQSSLDAQQAIEDAQKVVVDAAIDSYITASNAVASSYDAIQAAATASQIAKDALANIIAAPVGTLPDVSAMQDDLAAAQTAQADALAAALVAGTATGVGADAVLANVRLLDSANTDFDAAQGTLASTLGRTDVATQALVLALQAGGSTTVAQADYDAATSASDTADDALLQATVALQGAAGTLDASQIDLRDLQTTDQAPLVATALGAAGAYAADGQALLTVYMAGGDASEATKGALQANLNAAHSVYSSQTTLVEVQQASVVNLRSAQTPLEDARTTAAEDLQAAVSDVQMSTAVLAVKRAGYVSAATAAPAVFDDAAAVYAAALGDYEAAHDALVQAQVDYLDAHDAATGAFDNSRIALAVLESGFINMDVAAEDYASTAAPLLTFFLTPEAVDAGRANAEAAVTAAQDILTQANADYQTLQDAVKTQLKAYTEAASELAKMKGATAALRIPLNVFKSEQAQLTKDQATWTALVLTETVSAWCADLTEDASGLVSTIEIPGENKLVLIAPAAPAPGPADGLLTAREVQSPEQVFWNAAVLPGWQKWKPTYRRGTITAIDYDADTANVTLFGDVSSAQQLPINQTANLTAVPVDYMQCDAEAFDVGDVVVVKFTGQDWATPRVIGFCDNPKECGAAAGWFFSAAPGSYGDWSHGRGGEDYEWTASSSKRGGNVSYTSVLGTVSWWGSQGITCGSLTPSTGGSVFYRGLNIGVGGLVLGAALAKVGNTKYIVVLSLVTYLNAYVLIKVHATTLAAAVIQSFPVPAGEIAFSWNPVAGKYAYAKAPVFFDEQTGLKGATLVYLDGVDDARPRTCEYVANADLTGATRTVGAPLYIGEGSSSPDSYSQTLRIYAAAYYDVAGDLQTAYAECTSAGGETFTETLDGDGYTIYSLHTYTGAWTGSVVCGSETWWTGTSSLTWTYTLEQQLAYPVWSLRTTNRGVSLDGVADMGMDPSDKLGYNVRGFGFNVLCLDPRNPKSLVVEGLFGSGEYIYTERMDNPEPGVFYYTNTTVADAAANDYKAVGEAGVVILTDAYEHTATMDKGSPSGAMTADYAGPVIALGGASISAAGFSRSDYAASWLSHCSAVAKTNVVLLVPAKSGSPFVMVATDFTPATLLGASGLALPTRIYSGTPLLVGVIA